MISLLQRIVRLQSTVASQRRTINRLYRQGRRLSDRNTGLVLEAAALRHEVEQLKTALHASPDEARRLWIAYHDRCEQLTRANHAKSPKRTVEV